MHLVVEGGCCVCRGGGPSVWCYPCLLCRWDGVGCFRRPATPCPAPLMPCMSRPVGEAAREGKEKQQTGGLPISP